jgi:Transposase domain (DUF772)
MFEILVLQTLYTLSDDQTEYQLRDRLSFRRFAGLGLHDAVPDARRSGCSANSWGWPAPSSGCSSASMRRSRGVATSPRVVRLSTRRWSRRAGRG